MKKLLLVASTIALLMPLVTFADMLPDGYHQIKSCVQIDNEASFPAYQFYLYGTTHGGFPSTGVVTGKICGDGMNGKLFAVKKSDVPKIVQVSDASSVKNNGENYADWPMLAENKSILLWSTFMMNSPEVVADTNTLGESDYVLHIDSIGKTSMQAHQASVTNIALKDLPHQETPVPVSVPVIPPTNGVVRQNQIVDDGPNLLVTSVVVLVGLLGVAGAYRLWRKK